MAFKTIKSRGFTLIELLVVISIIGLLAAVGLVTYQSVMGRARFAKVLSDLTAIRTAGHNYYTQYNIYPYDRPPEALTVAWDPPSGFLVPNFINEWPKPPCTGWKYDWDDWVKDGAHNVANALLANSSPNQIVRVTLQDSASQNRFFYCIYDANVASVSPCNETGELIPNILLVTDKTLSCN